MKLIKKERTGSKVKKTYAQPQTPYQRLKNCAKFDEANKIKLDEIYQELDPIELQRKLNIQLGSIFDIVNKWAEERVE